MTMSICLLVFGMFIVFLIYSYSRWKLSLIQKYLTALEDNENRNGNGRDMAHQQEDIFSISGRVSADTNWCTRDNYLSADRYNRTQQTNKPPADDAPPSYEEAIRMATAASLADQVPPYSSSISNSSAMTSVIATEPKPSSN